MTRMTFIIVAAMLHIVAETAQGQTQQRRPPNIVVIVSDDMGYADIGLHGSRDIPTPNIDALMKSGVRFTDAYVTGPYCSPTRAGFLTGRYPQRFGHEFNPTGLATGHGLPLTEKTLADRLKTAGYRTAIFGKWHLGETDQLHPMSRGFDEFYGFLSGSHSYIDVLPRSPFPILDGRTPAAPISYLTETLANKADDFIRRNRAQPFFLYLAFNAVHTPMQAPDSYLARFTNISNQQRRTYAAMLSAMDDAIGKTMAALARERLDSNTLVVYFNDNGGPPANGSSNAPLRGQKRQTWEGGIRVPFAFRWPGRIPAGRVDARPIIQLDVMPTALAAAGIPVQSAWSLDGVNLLPFLTGTSQARPHESLYWRLGNNMAIRHGDWKLVKSYDGPLQTGTFATIESLSGAGLYNLANDIGETKNLAASEPARARMLAEAWLQWNKQLAKPLWGPGSDGRRN